LKSQDNKYWSTENPMLVHKMSLNNVVYAWCAVSAATMNGPIFFHETINSHHYGTYTPTAFVQHLSNHESTYAFLLQDSATSHTKINSVCCVLSVFCDGIMSSIL
jgi:hypothetical protein